jgi:hypothetical protein
MLRMKIALAFTGCTHRVGIFVDIDIYFFRHLAFFSAEITFGL